jgi:hypothetical protein
MTFRCLPRTPKQAGFDQNLDGGADVVDVVADARGKIVDGQQGVRVTAKKYQDVEIALTAQKVQKDIIRRLRRLESWIGGNQPRDGRCDHCSRFMDAPPCDREQSIRIVVHGCRLARHEPARGVGGIAASSVSL